MVADRHRHLRRPPPPPPRRQLHHHRPQRHLLTAPQVAAVLGYANHRSLTNELLQHPDHVEDLPSGRLRRFWYRQSIWDYADARPLHQSPGRPPGAPTRPHAPHPYADDPRLDAALTLIRQAGASATSTAGLGARLARHLGVSERTGQRLIATARDLHTAPPATPEQYP